MISSMLASLQIVADVTADESFATALESNVLVAELIAVTSKVFPIDYFSLSKKWGISAEANLRTVGHTTQQGIRTVSHPSLSWRVMINDTVAV